MGEVKANYKRFYDAVTPVWMRPYRSFSFFLIRLRAT